MYLIKQFFTNLIDTFNIHKEKGVRAGIQKLGKVFKKIFFEKSNYVIFLYRLSNEILFTDYKYDIIIHPITTYDYINSLNEVVGLRSFKPDCINWLHKVFSNGGFGIIAYQKGRPVGCCWASHNTPPSLFTVRIPLNAGDIYVHTLFVSQMNRGQKIGDALAVYILRFLKERGFKQAVAIVEKDNVAGLKLHKKIGYLGISEISLNRFLFWHRLRKFGGGPVQL